MHKRWCIIAGPRTGSSCLENMIYRYWKRLDPTAVMLGEVINSVLGIKRPVQIDSSRLLYRGEEELTKVQPYELITYAKNRILAANTDQPVVLRVFTQPEYFSESQYLYFFKQLESVGFKFISLNRNAFDRALSLYFMQTTKIVHRWKEDHGETISTVQGEFINAELLNEETLHTIHETWFDTIYNRCNDYISLQEKICSKLNHIKINYETMKEDCIIDQIPHADPVIEKTYKKSYRDKMTPESWKFVSKYKKNSIKNTACRQAWDYPVLSLSRNEFRNCCRAKTNKIAGYDFDKGTDLFLKSVPVTKVKKELLNGIRSDACSLCWSIEKANGKSARSGFNNFAQYVKENLWDHLTIDEVKEKLLDLTPNEIEDISNIEKIRMIEISLGNTCDLKCVYCNHHYSSQWAAEKLKYNEIPADQIESELPKLGTNTEYENIFWKWFREKSAYSIYYINFIGGEPLIIDKFYDYSNRIIEFYNSNETPQKRINLGVVTNFNSPKKYFEKFKELTIEVMSSNKVHLDFNVSLEAIGSRTEFIRTNTNWNLMLSNLENYLEFLDTFEKDNLSTHPKVSISFQIALNSLCISDLPNFFKFVIELQKKYKRRIGLRQNQVMNPEWCSPHVLPPSYSKYIDESIDILNSMKEFDQTDYPDYGRWSSYIEFLKGIKSLIENESKNLNARKAFVKNIDQLCNRRNLNFHNAFPEMIDFYEECKKLL